MAGGGALFYIFVAAASWSSDTPQAVIFYPDSERLSVFGEWDNGSGATFSYHTVFKKSGSNKYVVYKFAQSAFSPDSYTTATSSSSGGIRPHKIYVVKLD